MENQKIQEKFWQLLKDGEFHSYKEIAEKVWGYKLNRYLSRNINVTKCRMQKKLRN